MASVSITVNGPWGDRYEVYLDQYARRDELDALVDEAVNRVKLAYRGKED